MLSLKMRKYVLVLFSFISSTFIAEALADQIRLKLVLNSRHEISNLKWNMDKETQEPWLQIRKTSQLGQSPYFVLIHGKYLDNSKSLVIGGKEVLRNESGSFDLTLEIQGETNRFQLAAIDNAGSVQVESLTIHFPGWKEFQKNPTLGLDNQWSFNLRRIRVLGSYLNNPTGIFGTGGFFWTPHYGTPRLRIHAILGAFPVAFESEYYAAINYGLGCGLSIYKRLWVEANFGMQYWTDVKTHAPNVGGNLFYQLDRPWVLGVDQFFLGYSAFLPRNSVTSEFKAGVGIGF